MNNKDGKNNGPRKLYRLQDAFKLDPKTGKYVAVPKDQLTPVNNHPKLSKVLPFERTGEELLNNDM